MAILEAAGGKATDFSGNELIPTKNVDIVATNGKIHKEIIEIINK